MACLKAVLIPGLVLVEQMKHPLYPKPEDLLRFTSTYQSELQNLEDTASMMGTWDNSHGWHTIMRGILALTEKTEPLMEALSNIHPLVQVIFQSIKLVIRTICVKEVRHANEKRMIILRLSMNVLLGYIIRVSPIFKTGTDLEQEFQQKLHEINSLTNELKEFSREYHRKGHLMHWLGGSKTKDVLEHFRRRLDETKEQLREYCTRAERVLMERENPDVQQAEDQVERTVCTLKHANPEPAISSYHQNAAYFLAGEHEAASLGRATMTMPEPRPYYTIAGRNPRPKMPFPQPKICGQTTQSKVPFPEPQLYAPFC